MKHRKTPRASSVLMAVCCALTSCFESDTVVRAPVSAGDLSFRPDAAEVTDPLVTPFVGRYRFAGGDEERGAVSRAIDEVVSTMGFVRRGLARGRLVEGNAVPQIVTIEARGGKLRVAMDDRATVANLDGSVARVPIDGHADMDLTVRAVDALEQRFSGSDRGRVNRFELDGERLIMHVRVHATLLPRDVVYSLTFERI